MRNTLSITKVTYQYGIRFRGVKQTEKHSELLSTIMEQIPSYFANVEEKSIPREKYQSFRIFAAFNFYNHFFQNFVENEKRVHFQLSYYITFEQIQNWRNVMLFLPKYSWR